MRGEEGNKLKGRGNGEPQQDSKQRANKTEAIVRLGDTREEREERRAFWAEETACAKALRQERVWHIPRAPRKLVWLRVGK